MWEGPFEGERSAFPAAPSAQKSRRGQPLHAKNAFRAQETPKWRRKPLETLKTDSKAAPPFDVPEPKRRSPRKRNFVSIWRTSRRFPRLPVSAIVFARFAPPCRFADSIP